MSNDPAGENVSLLHSPRPSRATAPASQKPESLNVPGATLDLNLSLQGRPLTPAPASWPVRSETPDLMTWHGGHGGNLEPTRAPPPAKLHPIDAGSDMARPNSRSKVHHPHPEQPAEVAQDPHVTTTGDNMLSPRDAGLDLARPYEGAMVHQPPPETSSFADAASALRMVGHAARHYRTFHHAHEEQSLPPPQKPPLTPPPSRAADTATTLASISKPPLVAPMPLAPSVLPSKALPSLQELSATYKLAWEDNDFLMSDELRHVRLQLEHLKVERVLRDKGIESTVVIFGSARIRPAVQLNASIETLSATIAKLKSERQDHPDLPRLEADLTTAQRLLPLSKYYDAARELGRIVTRASDRHGMVVVTGGGPGVMEGANRGAHDAQGYSIGLNIVLPHEQHPNPYVTPDLCFSFHYFSIRKMHFLQRARALVAMPGGWGTFDELFECLTLIQTHKMWRIPVLLFGREFWEKVIRWEGFVETGVISPADLDLFQYVETAEEAWKAICVFYESAAVGGASSSPPLREGPPSGPAAPEARIGAVPGSASAKN
ncbi:hypothetical protein M427DRAFT_71260 [Gonapodya prolifera JEL478]|uniref:AMP nucleosidase n=1 Tax=Gonapodya prolifera (strain JEL478) TaxID=1344416 RepID=A0A139A9G2_GONPJ|nr:hypothetical protein M427DRAFT_71260 [Gonapodya prolifera JEL478]|eukprot:KXS13440.1 hypothetical protein M427DRAFT_71260 [Gonapodya prolifera JEL478]